MSSLLKHPARFHRTPIWLACGLGLLLALCGQPLNARDAAKVERAALTGGPLYFEANEGRPGGTAGFMARGRDCNVLIAPTEATLMLAKPAVRPAASPLRQGFARPEIAPLSTRSVRLRLEHANPRATLAGLDELPGKVNYLIGNNPSAWRTAVPLFSKVSVDDIYPGIRLVYRANQSARLEYDFILQPGADPEQISFRVEGADRVRVNPAGDLVLTVGREEIRQHKPVIYQETHGVREQVSGGYRAINATTIGFKIGHYDLHQPLVIDPVLSFSTYLDGQYREDGWAIALDASGDVYVCGDTLSANLNTTNAYQPAYAGTDGTEQFGDAFVAKFSPDASKVLRLAYLTYLGGRGQDAALGIATDTNGDAFVTGFTDSPDFPVWPTNAALPALQTSISGQNNNAQQTYPIDAFVTKIGPYGTNLIYSTYLGGVGRDSGNGIAVDQAGCAYVAGFTESTNFPAMTNASVFHYQTNFAGVQDAFVAKLDAGGTSLKYCTYLGGSEQDSAQGIAVDSQGYAYVTGFTLSPDFPTYPTNNSYLDGLSNYASVYYDAFFTKLSTNGDALAYSTYLGAENDDVGLHLAVDASDSVYLTGYTFSTNFPVTTVIPNTQSWVGPTNGLPDVYVTKLSPDSLNGNSSYYADYSVVFGGSGMDQATGIAVDAMGDACVVGITSSTNFPVTGTLGASLSPTNSSQSSQGFTNDVFITVLNPNASALIYSAYLGGSGNDEALGVATDPATGDAYLAGRTTSTNFPAVNSSATFLGTAGNSSAVFVAKVLANPMLSIAAANGVVSLSWPGFGSEFSLETNTNLASGVWTPLIQPSAVNGWHTVQLSPTNATDFFRLRYSP